MKTIKDIYNIFNERFPNAASFEVTLFGSLAATGKGHMTDKAILDTLQAPTEIVWKPEVILPFHPNGMLFKAFDAEKNLLGDWQVFSIGGGNLAEEGKTDEAPEVYPLSTMTDILNWCERTGRTYWEYVYENENQKEIEDYMLEVWRVMKAAVERGIQAEGVLPGPLNLSRKAATYHIKASGYTHTLKSRGLVYSYALAVSEENASGGVIVTAPTCGSCGVMPAVLYHLSKSYEFADQRIIRALVTAGLVGAMAAAAANQLFGGSPAQIEYAAEMALEHHLGMTCDPVCGLVQIPCIERNAYAAARALDSNIFSTFSDGHHRVSFDKVVETMKETGKDIPSLYKETSQGGLARDYMQMD